MQITIKALKGDECSLNVEPTTTIFQVKEQIEEKLKFPVASQKLLLAGRALNNENAVSSYPTIKNGSKIHLIVAKPGLRDTMRTTLKKHFTDYESTCLTNAFIEELEKSLNALSFDDLESLAVSL